MLGALNWTAVWFRPDGERHRGRRVAETIADYLVRGLRAAAAAAEQEDVMSEPATTMC